MGVTRFLSATDLVTYPFVLSSCLISFGLGFVGFLHVKS